MEWTLVLPKKTCATKHSKKYVPFVTRGRCSQKQKWRTVQNINSVSTENEIFKRNQSSKKDDRKREAQGPHHNQRCSEMTFLCAVWLIWERRTEISRVYGLEWLKRVCCELRWGICTWLKLLSNHKNSDPDNKTQRAAMGSLLREFTGFLNGDKQVQSKRTRVSRTSACPVDTT